MRRFPFLGGDFAQQGAHDPFATLRAGLFHQDLGLFSSGRLDFPIENAPAKCGQQLLLLAGGIKQHDHADVGTGKMLHQPGQQLDFVVRQGAGVMHDPDFGRRVVKFGPHRVFDRVVLQHLIKTGNECLGAGGEADFQSDMGSCLAQACHQQFAIVVQDRVVTADQAQTHVVLHQRRYIAFQAHAICDAEKQRLYACNAVLARVMKLGHVGTASGCKGLPLTSNSMEAGSLGAGRGIGSTPGCTWARLNT